ncbi:MAG: peptidase sortase [Actinomycetia bacterium]|nr:peptidase sortase [Actinomycetes bacterium]
MGASKGAYGVAAVLAVAGIVTLGKGAFHVDPPDPRFAGMWALQHIPDGSALPASPPLRVDIADAGVHAEVMPVGQNPDGTVEVPPFSRASYAGWYQYGPAPGVRGAAVVLGHVDDTHGAAAFYKLGTVTRGDEVNVTRKDGSVGVFEVDAVEKVPKTRFPTDRVYGSVRYAGLRLVTCGGRFDRTAHSYVDNVIVYAHLTGSHRAKRQSI